jgi:hypothetical protein
MEWLEPGQNKSACEAPDNQEQGCPEHHEGRMNEIGTRAYPDNAVTD